MIYMVTGGRDFADDALMRETLSAHGRDMMILIHGGASGADSMAGRIAAANGIHVAEVKALWDWFGPSAGPRRNEAMLTLKPDRLLAFPGGRGTAHMVSIATAAGVEVIHARRPAATGDGHEG